MTGTFGMRSVPVRVHSDADHIAGPSLLHIPYKATGPKNLEQWFLHSKGIGISRTPTQWNSEVPALTQINLNRFKPIEHRIYFHPEAFKVWSVPSSNKEDAI
jgi:hypothetical protein